MFWGFKEQDYFFNPFGRHGLQWNNIFNDTEQISLGNLKTTKEISQYKILGKISNSLFFDVNDEPLHQNVLQTGWQWRKHFQIYRSKLGKHCNHL